MTPDPAVWKKLDRANHQLTEIRALLVKQVDLLQQLVDATQGRTAPVVSAAELDEESDLVDTVYQLDVPEEPPVGTVMIGRDNITVVRKTSGWQVTGALLTSTWVQVLHRIGPLRIIEGVATKLSD